MNKLFGRLGVLALTLLLLLFLTCVSAFAAGPTPTSMGATGTITVTAATVNTSVVASPNANPSYDGLNITIHAVVSPASYDGSTVLTGTVTFNDGATPIGSVPLAGLTVSVPVPGTRSGNLAISTLAVGSHIITAVYSGDANYVGSTSVPYTQVVLQQYAYTLSSPTVAFGTTSVLSGAPVTMSSIAAPITVTNTGFTSIKGYEVLSPVFPAALTGGAITVTGSVTGLSTAGVGTGAIIAGNGGTETIVFTLTGTATGSAPISLSTLTFTLTPQS